MLKNNLKQIMEDRKLSQNGLAKKTGISRQVIINAVKNPFHVMDSNILTALLMELNMTLEEFGTLYTPKQYLDEMLKVIGFTTNNLDLLSRLVKEKTNFQLKYEPYSSNRTINFRIHKNSRIDFSGNVRAKSTWEGLVFEVIDFDLYPKKDGSFTKRLIAEYSQLLDAFETYAQILGFTSIKFRIFTDTNCLWENPMSIFREFEQNIDTATYSKEDSELIKLAILIKKGYFLTESSTKHFDWTQMYVKQINKHTVPLKQLELDFKSKKRRSFRSASSK